MVYGTFLSILLLSSFRQQILCPCLRSLLVSTSLKSFSIRSFDESNFWRCFEQQIFQVPFGEHFVTDFFRKQLLGGVLKRFFERNFFQEPFETVFFYKSFFVGVPGSVFLRFSFKFFDTVLGTAVFWLCFGQHSYGTFLTSNLIQPFFHSKFSSCFRHQFFTDFFRASDTFSLRQLYFGCVFENLLIQVPSNVNIQYFNISTATFCRCVRQDF